MKHAQIRINDQFVQLVIRLGSWACLFAVVRPDFGLRFEFQTGCTDVALDRDK